MRLRRIQFHLALAVIGLLLASGRTLGASGMVLTSLRCEYRENPLGVDSAAPQLSWVILDHRRGAQQTCYRILVASSPELLAKGTGDLWDSGRVTSDHTNHILYSGRALVSGKRCWWKVQAVDQAGVSTAWSPVATWTMGLLNPSDWLPAQWIGAQKPESSAADLLIGYHAAETTSQDDTKWVQVDLGKLCTISAVRLYPMAHAGKDGFGFPIRFRVEAADNPEDSRPIAIADMTTSTYPNPGSAPVTFTVPALRARFVRVTATQLWKRDATVYAFALRRLEVVSGGRDAAAGAPVTAKDSVERFGWGASALTSVRTSDVSPSPTALLRREFSVRPKLRRATIFVCGLGQYELSINGAKVGSALLTPGWSLYSKTCLYDTYDVTALVHSAGANAVGLVLATACTTYGLILCAM